MARMIWRCSATIASVRLGPSRSAGLRLDEQPSLRRARERRPDCRRAVDAVVELSVGAHHGERIRCGTGLLERRKQSTQLGDAGGVDALRAAFGEHTLDRGAQIVDVAHEARVDRADHRAPVRQHVEHALALEHVQRAAHRHVADRADRRDVVDLEATAWSELAGEDALAKIGGDAHRGRRADGVARLGPRPARRAHPGRRDRPRAATRARRRHPSPS